MRPMLGRNWSHEFGYGESLEEETTKRHGMEGKSSLPTHQMAGRVHVVNSASGDFLDHRFVWSCSLVYGSLRLLLTRGGDRLA